MTQELITIGADDAGNGVTPPVAFGIVNDNATDAEARFVSLEAGVTLISQESDFPVQDATTITLESQVHYLTTAAFSTAKSFIVKDAAVLSSSSVGGPILEYTGSGSMFNITDASFFMRFIQISHPNAQGFNFTDTVGGVFSFLSDNVRSMAGTKYGTFNNPSAVLIVTSAGFGVTAGLTLTGTSISIFSIDKFVLTSSSATFKGIDLGSAVAQTTEMRDMNISAPPGAFGISGLASSANIPAGRLAMINNCEFVGGVASLENITTSDVRWLFRDNTPTSDTIQDALLSFNGSSTETVISIVNTPVIVNAVWACINASHFACTVGGRVTFEGERDTTLPIDVNVGLISAGGGAINVTVYLAKNGSVISDSATTISISGVNQAIVPIPWQETVSENDFYEIFVENNTNTTNIIVESGKLRVA